MKKRQIDIIQAINNPKLFGSLFPDLSSWSAWLVFLKATFGLEMNERELELYRKCTTRSEPPKGGAKESYAIAARRGGKSRIVSFAGVFIACFHDFKRYLAVGESGMVFILSRDRDQSKIVFNYVGGTIRAIPALKAMVVAWRQDEIELKQRHYHCGQDIGLPGRPWRYGCLLHRRRGRVLGQPRCFSGHGSFPSAQAGNGDGSGGEAFGDQLALCKIRCHV